MPEYGLYEILMQSRKPIAKQFKKKVKEILKSLRVTGECSRFILHKSSYIPLFFVNYNFN